jgi:DNA-binding CsgD family transcriptional regulator/PAS domain-containing protein
MTGVNEARLLRIIDRIYASVEQSELWPETILEISEIVGGRRDFWGASQSGPVPAQHIAGTPCHGTLFLSRRDLRTVDEYAEQFGELITRFLKIVFMSMLWSRNEVAAREAIGLRIVRRYLPALEPVSEAEVSSPSRLALRNLIVALWEDGRVFSAENLHCMREIVPHLDRALRMQMRLSAADLHATMVSGALDYLTLGVVLINRSARPLWLNRRAQEILGPSDGLRLSSGGLTANSASDTRSLREMITAAVSQGAQGLMAINRGCESRPLLLVAVPLKPNGTSDDTDDFACGAVFISDPDRMDDPSIDSLRRAFELTYREAQAAIAVAHGRGLQAAADSMGVAVTTARSQLQQAFIKTGTSSQAELAALVHRTLSSLRHA